jgi:hypothetical protein
VSKKDVFTVYRDTQNQVHFEERPAFDMFVKHAFAAGEMFEIEARELTTTRSAKANRYYWGVVLDLIEQHTGTKADDIHDAMCEQFLPNEQKRVAFFNKLTGEELAVDVDTRRSSKLTGMAFYDFVEDVRQWARDFLQVETPDPDPEYWRKRPSKRRAA